MSLKLCSEALSGCSGCEMSLLNTGGGSLSLLDKFEILHMPILMDHKYLGCNGGDGGIHIPKAGVGLPKNRHSYRSEPTTNEDMKSKAIIWG